MTSSSFTETIEGLSVVFEPAPDGKGGFVASVPALDNCRASGDTFDETRENVARAILAIVDSDG